MKTHWQIYKELELIPDSVSAPQSHKLAVLRRLGQVYRSLLEPPSQRPSHEQQLEYLERCLALDCSKPDTGTNIWHKFWTFLNQPLVFPPLFTNPEPHVWKSADRAGYTWWHVYDPITGQTADLESEEEVCIWIEERLYRY
jgi:hypothetical protein